MATERMYAAERHQAIIDWGEERGRVDVRELAGELGVSVETVRKDLSALQSMGLMRRVHGGAVPVNRLSFEQQISSRTEWSEEKERIAVAALEYVPESGTIFVESGSTTSRLGEHLPDDRDLTVYTNSLPLALALAPREGITVITLGGRVRAVTLGEVDNFAQRSLREIFVDVAFLGTNGVSLDHGLTTPDAAEAEIKRLVLKAARQRVLLADHSKIGATSVWRYGDIEDIDVLITDEIPRATAADIQARGTEVRIV